ncbi:hypothetical protein PAPYR_3453 [Paratrimastix pyriformis]|uniref:Uncharacterized protein n=1 Tax=Paratrimastix pyriformis TaxID=342808 RepID=A0ABQ8UML4_9EUKA|nr:hypothetical protein PAPYR_3453 [Paratrimastix pyriformis]
MKFLVTLLVAAASILILLEPAFLLPTLGGLFLYFTLQFAMRFLLQLLLAAVSIGLSFALFAGLSSGKIAVPLVLSPLWNSFQATFPGVHFDIGQWQLPNVTLDGLPQYLSNKWTQYWRVSQ